MDSLIDLNIVEDNIDLPPIIVRYSASIGTINHLLKHKQQSQIVERVRIQISPRITEDSYRLNDQTIIITKRNKIIRPEGIDGVLQIVNENQIRWQSHKLIEDFNIQKQEHGLSIISNQINENWNNAFIFQVEQKNEDGDILIKGLRPPQIGGIHAIGAHWSLSNQPATIVMPTGTGKTETMLAMMIAYRPKRILVVVPSKVLRDQTARKFNTLGLLRQLGTINGDIKNPIVGIMINRPTSNEDLAMVEQCNVIITTMNAIAADLAAPYTAALAEMIDVLIVDEAHHVAARTWSVFKENFLRKRVLQFTATPYRRDGKLVDGKVIFNYPLLSAQQDGYFKPISFEPVNVAEEEGDRAIAIAAVQKLDNDIAGGCDHLIMARCESIDRATDILAIYSEIAARYNPILIHSEMGNSGPSLQILNARESRIVICVNMLGEGFDLPQLKIAAVHDTHKSIAILLQFTGRFTRTAGNNLGDATVIANIANPDVSDALERLYSEDADWNYLLSEISSEASQRHAALVDFLNESRSLSSDDESGDIEISNQLLRPLLSSVIFKAEHFTPEAFYEAISPNIHVHRVWLHNSSNTLYFVTREEPKLQWTRSRDLKDRQWDLFVVHFDAEQQLLFISSSNKDSSHETLAFTVGATSIIKGDAIFRCLVGINRLIFQNIGVRKYGRRNLSFAMYTGSDVKQALSLTEHAGSVKSNLSGTGWEDGKPLTIGCSLKGRVWSREAVTIPEFIEWSHHVGRKVLDETLRTEDILANVLIPEEIESLPDLAIINIDWPIEMLRQSEEKIKFRKTEGQEIPIMMFGLEILDTDIRTNTINFKIFTEDNLEWGIFKLQLNEERGFIVEQLSEQIIQISIGRISLRLDEYFSNYPPIIRFVDLSELDGNLLIKPNNPQDLQFPEEQFHLWDWEGVDISRESYWKNGEERLDSIQAKAFEKALDKGFEIIFDDDAPGEAADVVCLKQHEGKIILQLIHCKFSGGEEGGQRVKDVVEVASQAIRSAKWKWKFKDLCKHISGRERRLATGNRPTRFLQGSSSDLNKFVRLSKFNEIVVEILIVQPGFSIENHTEDQIAILAAAYSYLQETIGVKLRVIGSA